MRMTRTKKSDRGRHLPATAGSSTTTTAAAATPAAASSAPAGDDRLSDDQILESALSLHQMFEQQARAMLDRTDLDEEQKQNILVAMSCPCCGAGTMSYTAKLKR
jgi:Spy/CpxP family protein refolding chaperone